VTIVLKNRTKLYSKSNARWTDYFQNPGEDSDAPVPEFPVKKVYLRELVSENDMSPGQRKSAQQYSQGK
jgi:hypothetical protein